MSALPARSGETGTGGPSKMRPAPARPHANTLPPRSRLLGSTLRGPPGWTAPRSSTASRARSDMQPDRLSVCSRSQVVSGAGDGVRTRDIQLGKLTLCQLSYSRSGDGQFTDRWLGRQAVSRAGGRRHGSPRGRSWAREGLVQLERSSVALRRIRRLASSASEPDIGPHCQAARGVTSLGIRPREPA
jgi:hypothetical protein